MASRLRGSILTPIAMAVLVGACSGVSSSPAPSTTVGPSLEPTPATGTPTVPSAATPSVAAGGSATPALSGPQPLHVGSLSAGEYRTTAFQPALTFTLTDGWSEYFPDEDDEIALGGPKADMNITRPAQVADPAGGTVDAPEDLVAWFQDHPRLAAGQPRSIQVAGIESTMFDLEAPTNTVDIFAYPPGNMRVPAGIQSRIIVVPLDGPDLVLVIYQTSGTFEDAIAATQPVVDSLAIAP